MSRPDVYTDVTNRIIASLEEGTVPWRKPWVGGGPYNVETRRPYSGINIFLLTLAPYGDPRWGTYEAIQRVGGQVRRGEKSTPIVFLKRVSKQRRPKGKEELAQDDDSYFLFRYYSVFNAEQADSLPELKAEFENDPIERAEEIALRYIGPTVVFGGAEASYSQTTDTVRCPKLDQFERTDAYYSTLYHELVHSTGARSRLDRLEATGFGTGPYAKEELVAEMGAAMLCGIAGIDNLDQSAAYIDGWLERLRSDRTFVTSAAGQAQKAADLILGEAKAKEPEQQIQLAV